MNNPDFFTAQGRRSLLLQSRTSIDWAILDPYYAKPNMLMLARHAPHPHAAALLIDWTLSEEGQSLLRVWVMW